MGYIILSIVKTVGEMKGVRTAVLLIVMSV